MIKLNIFLTQKIIIQTNMMKITWKLNSDGNLLAQTFLAMYYVVTLIKSVFNDKNKYPLLYLEECLNKLEYERNYVKIILKKKNKKENMM